MTEPNDRGAGDEVGHLAAVIATQQEISLARPDPESVMALIAERTQGLTHADGAAVELSDGDEMVYRAATGLVAAHLGLRLRLDGSLSGLSVRTGEILRCDDTEADDRVDRAACRRIGARSMIVVPLAHGGRVVGVLKVLAARRSAFGDRDVRTLQWLAGLLAAALDRAAQAEANRALLAERTAALAELHREREFLRAVLDHAGEGIVACDAAGRLTVFNRATRLFHGLPEAPLPPDRWAEHYDLRRPDGSPMPTAEVPLFRAFQGETLRDAEMVIAPKAGPPRTVLASGQAVRGAGGERLGAVVVMRDVTESRRAEGERAARAEAEAAGRARDEFLAVLSHELRTPLTPVLLAASAMLDDPATPASVRPTLELARQNLELEARLVDDLLDVTRISRGGLTLHPEVTDTHALILRAVALCRDAVAAGGLRLTTDLSAPAHHVRADPARLQQVFWNLVQNAVKFSPRGGSVAVRSRTEAGGDGPLLVVEVSDHGVGIEPDLLPLIFDAFRQGEAVAKRRFGGLGLGLTICHAVAAAHGGRLSASSPGKGGGSTFTLELAAVPAPPTPPEDPRPSPDGGGRSLKVLLVEDDEGTARVMARLLRSKGCEVAAAGRVSEALAAASSSEFDLVISDIGLPDGTGWELMHQLTSRGPTRAIALTGFGTADDERRSREAGFLAHLTKPVNFQRLEAEIRRLTSGPD